MSSGTGVNLNPAENPNIEARKLICWIKEVRLYLNDAKRFLLNELQNMYKIRRSYECEACVPPGSFLKVKYPFRNS